MKIKSILLPVIAIILFSCDKNVDVLSSKQKTDCLDISCLSSDEISLRNNLQKVSSIVADIAIENEVYNEIYSGVKEINELGFDEQYRFEDILYPSTSVLKSAKLTTFATKFKNSISKDGLKSANDIESFLINENVQIYWPYSGKWDGSTQPYITFAPLNQDDINYGFRKSFNKNGEEIIDSVLIDDDFAYKNPVWIINFCDNSTDEMKQAKLKSSNLKSTTVIHQLSVGQVKSTVHYDGLFSGGDEYKFCIIGGSITSFADTIAIGFDNIQSVNLTREQIREKSWKYCYYELDDDWYVETDGNEGNRRFGLIEYDPVKTTYKLTFEPKVTIKTVTVSVGSYTITMTSNDNWIKTDSYQRATFLSMNKTDTGNGLYDGYQVYASGDVYWTLPIREF